MTKIVQIFVIAWFKFPSIKKKKNLQWKAYIKSLINHFKKFLLKKINFITTFQFIIKCFLNYFCQSFLFIYFQIAIRKDSSGGNCQSFFWLCSFVGPNPWPSSWFVVPIQPKFLHTTIFNFSSLFSLMSSFFLHSTFM